MTVNVRTRRGLSRSVRLRLRVWLNGVEVTARCFYADGRRGVVRVFKHDDTGRPYIENPWAQHWNVPKHLQPRIATEELRGHVRWGKVA